MKVYIDSEFKCHVSPWEGLTEVEVSFFDNKCNECVEGYRYIASGSVWIREDGVEFAGEMVNPWKNYNELAMAQLDYLTEKMAEAPSTDEITAAIEEGVNSIWVSKKL